MIGSDLGKIRPGKYKEFSRPHAAAILRFYLPKAKSKVRNSFIFAPP
jgi:hypothetical protein